MAYIEEILKNSVVNNEGASIEISKHLAGKTLLLYFSAGWCPPCKSLTQKLTKFYTTYRETKNFEIIFISYDNDKLEFESYYKLMPWLAVKYAERDIQESISNRFQVEGIPTLLVLNPETGSVLNTDAYSEFLANEDGSEFPWEDNTSNTEL